MSVKEGKAISVSEQSFFQRTWRSIKQTKFLHFLILPGIIYFIIFHYIPIYGLLIGFKDFDYKTGIWGSEWVGLKHFIRFFTTASGGFNMDALNVVKNTFVLSLYSHIFNFFPPIILALFINEVRTRWVKSVVQTISYLPHFISVVAIIGMVSVLLSTSGAFNQIIKALGGTPINFLQDPKYFRTIYVGTGVWQSTGWSAIIYIAALSGVDAELYEAASIDGATRVQKMFKISIPCIKETIIILLIMNMGHLMSASTDKVLLLQNSVTQAETDVIGTYIYRRGLVNADYSYSTAVGILNMLINLIMVVTVNAISRKYSETSLF